MAGIIFLLALPVLWQLPRTFWPLHLDETATHFTGLYRRYKVDTFTGTVSDISTSSTSQTVGSVSATTSGMMIGGTFTGTTTVNDRRKTFKIQYQNFFLRDRNGTTRPVSAANVGAPIGNGQLVSVAWIVHNGKTGNAFMIYNHTTGEVYVEQTRRGMKNAPRGLTTMVLRLPLVYQVIMWLGIVTWPVIILFAVGVQVQLRWFRKHAVKPLVKRLSQQVAGVNQQGIAAS